ncbi:MAG: hypothetical protein L6R36_007718, partial [Xanthoria steineri]
MPPSRRSTTLRKIPPPRQQRQRSQSSSINARLCTARDYLRTHDPSTDQNFLPVYHSIRSFLDNDLASAKQLFDMELYNDVQAMLRVHGERMDEPRARASLPLASSRASKVFVDDLAYEGPSSASTAATSAGLKVRMDGDEEQKEGQEEEEHPYEEGELLIFEPRPFGPKAPGYSHPAPKEVMGFDPVTGFGSRHITSSEEEMFPGTESARKRVMDKGFAQVDLSKTAKKAGGSNGRVVVGGGGKRESADLLVEVHCKPMVQGWLAESKRNKEKGKAKEVVHPDVATDRIAPSRISPIKGKVGNGEILYPDLAGGKQISPNKSKASPTKPTAQSWKFSSSKKPTSPKQSSSSKRPYDEGFVDPITLSKRIKVQEAEPEPVQDESAQDYPYDQDADTDDPANNIDDLEARRVFGLDDNSDEEALTAEDNLDMQIEEPVDLRSSDPNPASRVSDTCVHQEKGGEAVVADPDAEKPAFRGLSLFTKKFLQPWGAGHKSKNEDDQRAHQDRYSAPFTSQSQVAGAPSNLNDHPLAEESSVEDTQVTEDSNDEEYLDEDAAFIPLEASEASPATPKPSKSRFLEEIERHERESEGPKTKATSPKQRFPYQSPTLKFGVVPPTPPAAAGSKGIGTDEVKEVSGSTLPVPFVMPLTPPPVKSSPTTARKEGAKDTITKEHSNKQSTAKANLEEAARKYWAAEEAAKKARVQRDAILKEAKEEEIKQKEAQAARLQKAQKEREEAKSSSKLLTPPVRSPTRTTPSPKASMAPQHPPTPSSGPRYGYFGIIPPEIANAPATYPSPKNKSSDLIRIIPKATSEGRNDKNRKFYPGDPIFLFGETRYLTVLKSRQIEKDLASNDKDVQAEIDSRPLFGMFARYRLPKPPAWWEAEMDRGREKVVEGRVQKTRRKREPKKVKSFC